MIKDLFTLNTEVQSALAAASPVVALESTVIAHGLPRPQNIETAKRAAAALDAFNAETPPTVTAPELVH